MQKLPEATSEKSKEFLDLIEKKTWEKFWDKGGQELAAIIEEMLKLFGTNEYVPTIDNEDLDKRLQSIAQSMSSSLRIANETVKDGLIKRFTYIT